MTKTTRPRRPRRGSDQPSYEEQWPVKATSEVPAFQVKIPKITENTKTEDSKAEDGPEEDGPEFVRLDMRRKGLRGKLAPRPVLHRLEGGGSGWGDELLVPKALEKLVRVGDNVTVTDASERAFRWYRFFRSFGTLFGTLATIIGALLVTLGAISPKSGPGLGLLIGGSVLTFLGVIALLVSFWHAPAGGAAAS